MRSYTYDLSFAATETRSMRIFPDLIAVMQFFFEHAAVLTTMQRRHRDSQAAQIETLV